MNRFKFEDGFFFWLGIILITLSLIVIQDNYKWLSIYPKELIIPFDKWLNAGMGFLITYFGWFFMGMSWLLEWPIDGVRLVLQALPWSVMLLYSVTRLHFFTLTLFVQCSFSI